MTEYAQLLKDRQSKAEATMKARGYATGGAVKHDDEKQDKKLIKSEFKKLESKEVDKLACGGAAKPKARADKMARGGKAKKGAKVQVNVIAGGGKQPVPVPVPAGMQPPMKRGGMVKMDAGAGGAKGRMEKIKAYGKKAK